MNTVRWGLLSTANINRKVIPAIRASKRGQLIAVASRSRETAEAYATQWEIPKAFGSYEAMLQSGQVDAVYISLPNHLHTEWSLRAMYAGLHVLCEKPLALTVAEVDAMIAASRTTGRVCAEAFMYRHHPQTKITGEWVRSGKLGEICVLRGVFDFSMHNRRNERGELNVRLVPEYGGGCLWDVGVYPLSFAQFIMGGPPEWVIGAQWVGESGVDETFCGQLHYTGGRIAQITSSFRSPWYTYAEILGTEGRLTLNRPFHEMDNERRLVFTGKDGRTPHEIRVPKQELYSGEIEDMHTVILDGAPPYLSLEESRDHVRTVLALYESARTRQMVRLSA